MNQHPLVVIMDEDPIKDHVFATLKMEIEPNTWISMERRCVVCNKLPLDLLALGGTIAPCERVSQP